MAAGTFPAATVDAGALRARIAERPWSLSLQDARSRTLLRESPGRGSGPIGALGFRTARGWYRATGVVRRLAPPRGGFAAELATTDPRWRRLVVIAARDGEGALRLEAAVAAPDPGVLGVGVSFGAVAGERQLGFGERSNAVDQRGREVESYVGEGPYANRAEWEAIAPTIPPWGIRIRPDATYFPMPWMLSTRGFGVLVDNTETSRFHLGDRDRRAWSVEVDAPRLSVRFLGGPRPADVLRRLVRRTGVQPAPAAPWLLGPWFQTGHANQEPAELAHVRALRRADAPVSAVETHMRYLPCGADRGHEAEERRRTAAFHAAGLAALTYQREAVCDTYRPEYQQAITRGLFPKRPDGSAYTYRAFVGTGLTDVGLIDFTNPAAVAFHRAILARAVANGYDGWMEDYGEYIPPDAHLANGQTGVTMHNDYPRVYHCAAAGSARALGRAAGRPLVRFVRSGWTGVQRCAQIVWGGDPTTGWGFDGLRSQITQGLTMGLSGIGIWGSDIGGFFTTTQLAKQFLTPELLARWIEFGLVSGVMRTKGEGIGVPLATRPQIWNRPTLPVWRRYAKLRTQLYPYLSGAVATYRRDGLPVMRHLALAYPTDPRAAAEDDAFLFGPDLLAAPVTRPGARSRRLYLPRARWIDLWRSARWEAGPGTLRLGAPAVLRGGRTRTLHAPLAELPLLVRAGALIPLLPPDVDTLADRYGHGRGLVHLADRRARRVLLAFPRGRSHALTGEGDRLDAREARGVWSLAIHGAARRAWSVQASLRTLERPFAPRRVRVDGRALPARAWRYDRRTGVLRVTTTGRSARIVVSAHR